jgi:hypothetical protein
MLIIFTLGYMINAARNEMASIIPTEVVRMGTVDVPETITAIIIRDERVSYAPRDGQIVFAVSEFERVQSGMLIASIQDSAAVEGINQDVQALDHRAMQQLGALRIDQNDPGIIRVDNHIRGQVSNRSHAFTSLNFTDLFILRDNLTHAIDNRNQLIISGSIQAGGDYYIRQQEELRIRLGLHSTNMYARNGGIMTPVLDNLENIFTVADMDSLTREQLNFTPDPFPLFPARDLKMNDPAFKIVGNVWYIAAYIPNEMIRGFAANQMRNIYVENPTTGSFELMNLRVHSVIQGTRDSRVIFRSTRYVIDFMHQRNVNIRITQEVETGLKIPNTAVASRQFHVVPLVFIHGVIENTVLRYAGEERVSVPVIISDWGTTHVLIPTDTVGLAAGDVLSDGRGGRHTLSEIRTIQGVYWANNGYARFREIFTDDLILDRGGTTLLCPIRNRGSIREFDSIVVDASLVKEGDIIW